MPEQHKTLSIGKCCAGAGFGVPGVGGVVMVIPRCAVVTGTSGTSDCSVGTAADSWPHPGLVELPNGVDATPPGAVGARYRLHRERRHLRSNSGKPRLLATKPARSSIPARKSAASALA